MEIKTVKLIPRDVAGTPEELENRYERRRERRKGPTEPRPTLKPIEHNNMQELLERAGLGES